MVHSLKQEPYGTMLKKLDTGFKGNGVLPFLIQQRKDGLKDLETEFSKSVSSIPPKIRPFLRNGFRNGGDSLPDNVRMTKSDVILTLALLYRCVYAWFCREKRKTLIEFFQENAKFQEIFIYILANRTELRKRSGTVKLL